jgi:hypothetical protein
MGPMSDPVPVRCDHCGDWTINDDGLCDHCHDRIHGKATRTERNLAAIATARTVLREARAAPNPTARPEAGDG